MNTAKIPDIFTYRNYRFFLRDYYDARKSSEYGFSYRRFARSVGLSSPNYLKLVTEGARNLTPEMAERFAKACGLSGEAADYFCNLVDFNQATGAENRERCHKRLTGHRRYRETFKLEPAHAAYHSEWYIPAIRELMLCPDFQPDPKWIAKRMRPAIGVRKAAQALKTLRELGLVREEDGRLVQSEPLVATGEGPLGHHIMNFHRTMLERAADALEHVGQDDREFGALTLAVSEERFKQIKQRLYEFRQKLLQESVDEQNATMVVEVNFQLFPLTTKEKRDE